MRYWNEFNQPPKSALKTIKGGRLKGMSDINPIWRYKAMTETFGTCGVGWKFEIIRLWFESGENGEMFAFAEIRLFIKEDDKWSDAIPGIGGSKLIKSETNGLFNNDEAPKMAVTDALGTAMKMLGVAADVYAGLYDGSKYQTESGKTKSNTGNKAKPEISARDKIYYDKCLKLAKADRDKYDGNLFEFGKGKITSAKDIPVNDRDKFLKKFDELPF